MNRIYRIIWSHIAEGWVAVSETATASGKVHSKHSDTNEQSHSRGAGRHILFRPLLLLVAGMTCQPALAQPPAVDALPTGGYVSAGQATISQTGNRMQVLQGTDKAALNWQSFDIGSNAGVTFRQPSAQAVALNRVAGNDPSQIFGSLNANGKVILINPNGVVFGAGSRVDTAGLIATTKALSDADFMNGHYHFAGGGSGTVRNDGTLIAAPDGTILLIADNVINTGTMQVRGGTVALLSADELQVGADWRSADVIRSSLSDLHTVTVENLGQIDVSAAQGGWIVLDGGQATVQSEGLLLAVGEQGRGGSIHLSGMQAGLMHGSQTDASGASGGGDVLVGGDWQGSGGMAHASATYMDGDALVKVNATAQGNGGKAVLWSDGYTNFRGRIQANGAGSGNGGMVETSGKEILDAVGSVTAYGVHAGNWLLDPADVTITSAAGDALPANGTYAPGGTTTTGTISNADINAALDNGTSVTISTTASTATRLGHLVQNADADIIKSAGGDATLTLIASLDLALFGNISSTSGKLNVVLDASGNTNVDSGGILFYKDISTNGGSLTFKSSAYAGGSPTQLLKTSGGALTFNYDLLLADGLTIDTISPTGPSGEVRFGGRVDSGDSYSATPTASDWDNAQIAAIGQTGGGSAIGDTYLATPLSMFENLIASRTANFVGAWLGGELNATETAWVWAAGPKAGLVFNTSRTNQNVPTGVYANWSNNPPEPQNESLDQTKLQFIGTEGFWNDFTPSTVLIGVVQKNLAASPLVIKATGANVNFGGAVGGLKALLSLTVDGVPGISGGEVITEQGQSYNNPITTLGAATLLKSTQSSLTIDQPIFYGGGTPSTLTISAKDNVFMGAPIATVGGALSVVMMADNTGLGVGTVTSSGPVNTAGGAVTLTASSGIELNGVLNPVGGNITLTNSSSGNIAVAPGIGINTTGNVEITNGVPAGVPGTGMITLNNVTGSRITIASNVNDLAAGANAITLNGPVAGSDAILVTSLAGDIEVKQGVSTTLANSPAALIIGAGTPTTMGTTAGGNVKLTGNSTLSVGNNSRAVVYTGSIDGSTGTGVAGYPGPGNYRYGVAYGEVGRLANPAGVFVQYREQPVLNMTPSGKVYDGDPVNARDWTIYTVDGWRNGDTGAVNPLTGELTLNGNPGLQAIDAGQYTATPNGLVDTLGYLLNIPTNSVITIAKRPLTATGIAVDTRVYDTTTNATATGGSLLNVVKNDDVSMTGMTVQFANKNAGVNKQVLVNAGLAGTRANNYFFDAANSFATGTITKAPLTLTDVTPLDRVYDGTTVVRYTGAPELLGVFGVDVGRVYATADNVFGQFVDKHVGVDKPVIAGSTTASLDGVEAGNYEVTTVIAGRTVATVTPALLQVNATPSSKLFDALADSATPPTIINLMPGDSVSGAFQVYTTIWPGKGKTLLVVPGFLVDDGNGGNNYIVTSATARGEIKSIPTPSGTGANGTSPESTNLDLQGILTAFDDIRQKAEQADYFLYPGDEYRHSSTHAVITTISRGQLQE